MMMQRSARRILYSAEKVQHLLAQARRCAFTAEHERRLAVLQEEVAELREILALVVALMREQADAELADLRHQLETALAHLVACAPQRSLH
jgi:hypothetical protein